MFDRTSGTPIFHKSGALNSTTIHDSNSFTMMIILTWLGTMPATVQEIREMLHAGWRAAVATKI